MRNKNLFKFYILKILLKFNKKNPTNFLNKTNFKKTHQMEDEEKKPVVTQMNEEALKNMAGQQTKMENYTIYGEYEYIRIPLEKRNLISEAIDDINQIAAPTLQKLEHEMNRVEIQDRIYRKISGYENGFNSCIMMSKDIRDVNYCSDKFIGYLKNDVRQHTIDVLKDY